ncbi:hypothetical protein SUGI_1173950 [Cryptomeria japonica]|uniref:uncharacterized protein LOC131034701 isoform X2 n=1 Tax=Cryptomeria japonica TaxID=3369 RepID=UPI00241468BB|nr:uncharacterized protein LOC131034701 isoform X2 [Cryptomeria japonica]GLJ54642.1 hypothetical protein SUGI_1173950 [Cryptomeria japonica]
MAKVKTLLRASLPPSLLPHPSPGSLQSTRLAAHMGGEGSYCCIYIASGGNVYTAQISMTGNMVLQGKESLLIPMHTQVMAASGVYRCPHRAEIQSVALSNASCDGQFLLGTVDSYGNIIVSALESDAEDAERITYTASPQDSGVGEGGWAGINFNPSQNSMVAVARSLCKSIDLYDRDIHIRTLHTLWHPTSLCFLTSSYFGEGNSSVLAVTEGSHLSIWDLRTNQQGGCVQRVSGSSGDPLYAVCSSSYGFVGTGGAERSAVIFDHRRWSILSRWTGCLKYEITGLMFSDVNPDFLYVHGLDYEVVCGRWRGKPQRSFSFRGDSSWLGFNKCSNLDVIAGWCESGSIFVAEVVQENSMDQNETSNAGDVTMVNASSLSMPETCIDTLV